jgi:hypothetical protein
LKEPEGNLLLSQKQKSILQPPGNAQDLLNLEKSSAANATEYFLKTVMPKLESLVP